MNSESNPIQEGLLNPTGPIDVLCMACSDGSCNFKPMKFQRRPVGEHDILIDMKFCGICHSDLHTAAGHLDGVRKTRYPCVPGHELSGVCVAIGSKVDPSKFKVGDFIGVGCMVDSCLNCSACLNGEEQFCKRGSVGTYNGTDEFGRAATYPVGGHTLGGYTNKFVVHERFAILIPPSYPLEYAGPIMCSGITLYDPLIRHGAREGTKVAVVGLGGLGQMGVRLGKALKCEVTAISRGTKKEAFALSCGASHFISSTNNEQMKAAAGSFDLVLNTIPFDHDYTVYSALLRRGGKHVILGLNSTLPAALVVDGLVCGMSKMKAGMIGSVALTQEVLNLCDREKIYPKIQLIGAEEINSIYEKLDNGGDGDEGIRFVLDIATLNQETSEKCSSLSPPHIKPLSESGGAGMSSTGSLLSAICAMLCCCRWC